MSELGDQRDYWNNRAKAWDLKVPLIPDEAELEFFGEHIADDGDTLILGATRQLTKLAIGSAATVTSVDYAKDVIDELRIEGVEYHCADWLDFLDEGNSQYDTIMTDGGLLCLDFPKSWQRIGQQIYDRLKPSGTFVARMYVNTEEDPKDEYENPELNRFVTSMGGATAKTNWMVHPKHGAYANYDMYYTFPPRREIDQIFGKFVLADERIPEYEEGDRFPSFAWQKPHSDA